VFIDVDNIGLGDDFVQLTHNVLESCTIFVAVIGPQWLNAADGSGRRRLENPKDYVRAEVATALTRSGVRVIPLLVHGAIMPSADDLPDDLKGLATRNALEITHERFRTDIQRLINTVEMILEGPAGRSAKPRPWLSTQANPISRDNLRMWDSSGSRPVVRDRRAAVKGRRAMSVLTAAAIGLSIVAGFFFVPKRSANQSASPTSPPTETTSQPAAQAPTSEPSPPQLPSAQPGPVQPASRRSAQPPIEATAKSERPPAVASVADPRPAAPPPIVPRPDAAGSFSTVYIYRKTGETFGKPSVFLAERELARLTGGKGFRLRLPPGPTIFRVQKMSREPLVLKIESGRTYYLKNHYSFRRDEHLLVMDAAVGLADMKAITMLENQWIFDHEIVLPLPAQVDQ